MCEYVRTADLDLYGVIDAPHIGVRYMYMYTTVHSRILQYTPTLLDTTVHSWTLQCTLGYYSALLDTTVHSWILQL